MKVYDIEMVVSKETVHVKRRKEYRYGLSFEDTSDLQKVIEFMEGMKKIVREGVAAFKREDHVELEITRAVYERMPEGSPDRLRSVDFDRWTSDSWNNDIDETGIHFNPDTRYTSETHDIWLDRSDPLEGLKMI